MSIINKLARGLAIKCLRLYQAIFANKLFCCRFYPSCSNYAIDQFQKTHFLKAFFKMIVRIISCNPLIKSNYAK